MKRFCYICKENKPFLKKDDEFDWVCEECLIENELEKAKTNPELKKNKLFRLFLGKS